MDTPSQPPTDLYLIFPCDRYLEALVRRDGLHQVIGILARMTRQCTAGIPKPRTREYVTLAAELLERAVEYLSMVPDPPGETTKKPAADRFYFL